MQRPLPTNTSLFLQPISSRTRVRLHRLRLGYKSPESMRGDDNIPCDHCLTPCAAPLLHCLATTSLRRGPVGIRHFEHEWEAAACVVEKLSTSSLVSTTGVQIHNANSLCMDTIAEAAASEAEEMSQEDNSQVPADTPAAPPAPDVPTASQSDAKEDTQEKNSEKTEEQLPAETEAEAPEEDQEGDLGTAPHTGSEDVAPSVTQTPHQTEVEGAPVHGDVEGVTLQQHYNQAYIADELEEQPIQV
ncbi:hypothetical protein GWK47_016101 [Chionoecetes opilio]|uniref:Uncharacterized protein n=1 Tax=Chionoecetes opilio TaxID=41210 RepID=A0A8J4XTP0_CHIOP|nr:hypothetical protein GWK47_016101 [Chionoecetes opilio]